MNIKKMTQLDFLDLLFPFEKHEEKFLNYMSGMNIKPKSKGGVERSVETHMKTFCRKFYPNSKWQFVFNRAFRERLTEFYL